MFEKVQIFEISIIVHGVRNSVVNAPFPIDAPVRAAAGDSQLP